MKMTLVQAYEILGINQDASESEVKAAYKYIIIALII
jgi:curved DNA-binding protein CbpA